MKDSTFDKLKQLLRNSIHLITSITTAAMVYVLISDVRFLRRFIPSIQWETIYLLTWDAFLLTYLLLTFRMFAVIDLEKIKKRAHAEYEKKSIMLVLICLTSVVSIIAIVHEMRISAQMTGWLSMFHLAVTFGTLVMAWLFIHTLFALYYAHGYYDANNNEHYPLDFPYENSPDYWDFMYFSLGIGASGQTSDISFTSRKLRRIGMFHGVLSFFFNTAVLALMMELTGSIISN